VISKTLNTFVMLLAVLGVLIALGWVSVTREVQFEILNPAYLVSVQEIREEHSRLCHSELNDFLDAIAQGGRAFDFIIVDRPIIDSTNFLKVKLSTNGVMVWSCVGKVLDDGVLLSEFFPATVQAPPDPKPAVSGEPVDMRVGVKCAFDHLVMSATQSAPVVSVTSDTLFNVLKRLSPEYLKSMFLPRSVYNFVNIENPSSENIEDIVVRILEPRRTRLGHSWFFDIAAWTLPEGLGASKGKDLSRLDFKLPVLRAGTNIQLLVTTKSALLKNEDISIQHSRLKSINNSTAFLLLLGCLALSVILHIVEKRVRPLRRGIGT